MEMKPGSKHGPIGSTTGQQVLTDESHMNPASGH